MIEVIDCRELTEKEQKKQELQQILEQKKREIEELESLISDEDTHNSEGHIIICEEETEKVHGNFVNYEKDNGNESLRPGRERLQQKIGSLSAEEEKIVSKAISKDNQEDVLSDEKLAELREKSQREYEAIVPDIRFSPIKAITLIAIMCIVVIICSIFMSNNSTKISNSGSSILHDAIESVEEGEEIVIEVDMN